MNNPNKEWEKFGAEDPYYWVTTFEKYRGKKLSDERYSEFFTEGTSYLSKLLGVIQQHAAPNFKPTRVLDFGCGVGRIAIPLATIANEVVGLDISENMLEEARKNKDLNDTPNLNFFQSDNELTHAKGKFNFIHSIYVFQHIPFPRGKKIVKRMLERLDCGGVMALQFLVSNDLSKIKKISYWMRIHIPGVKNILNLLHGKKWNSPMMQLNNYNLNQIIGILKEGGCEHVYMRHTRDNLYNGVIVIAQKDASKTNPDFIDLGKTP